MKILLYNNEDTFFASTYTYTAEKKIIAKAIASGRKGKKRKGEKEQRTGMSTPANMFSRNSRDKRTKGQKGKDRKVEEKPLTHWPYYVLIWHHSSETNKEKRKGRPN